MNRRYVRLDPQKLDYLRLKKGWTVLELEKRAQAMPYDLDGRTVGKIIDGEEVFLNKAKVVAHLLGADDLVSVLHPELLSELRPPSSWDQPLDFFRTIGEWEAVEPVEGEQQTANGLRYDIWKVRHRHVANRLGRAKCFALLHLSTNDRTRLKTHLTRHSEICDRIGAHPNIARNVSAAEWEHGELWWVIDEWIDGETLHNLLSRKSLSPQDLPAVMRHIAEGLRVLHKAEVVRRELSPRFVLLRKQDMTAVLTDFELAKLLEGAPTVSPKKGWHDDAYRAIEVEGDAPIDARADIYSWGRILVHAVCGELPAKGQEADALSKAKLPPAVRRVVLSCVAMPRSDRPDSVTKVVAAIKNLT
jgi:serine/threonine protein kinase